MSLLVSALLLLAQAKDPGTPESLLYKLTQAYRAPGGADPSLEAMGLASSDFAVRYVSLLVSLQRSFETGRGFEGAYKAIRKAPAGPKGSMDHLAALAESLKSAVRCKECKDGKVACSKCLGKGRIDLPCKACDGAGRLRPSGAIGGSDVTVKCRNCEGNGVFRNVTCALCSRSGAVACTTCKGRPWPEARCDNASCKDGRAPCAGCSGTGQQVQACPDCKGGRRRAPGATPGADVTMKCRTCEVNGQQGNGMLKLDCPVCQRTGRVTCDQCGGLLGRKKAAAVGAVTDVYTTERCADCDGAGWPTTGRDIACDSCLGLGLKVKPSTDPSKTIEGKRR